MPLHWTIVVDMSVFFKKSGMALRVLFLALAAPLAAGLNNGVSNEHHMHCIVSSVRHNAVLAAAWPCACDGLQQLV